eukprot:7121903-Lingulodinium_polyedra.AAC.1
MPRKRLRAPNPTRFRAKFDHYCNFHTGGVAAPGEALAKYIKACSRTSAFQNAWASNAAG